MTREEAIKIIKESPLYDNTTWEYAKELHEAIQTLEQEPCEDAVSRQAAMDFIRGLRKWYVRSEDGKFNNVGLLYDDVMFGLDRLPSVTPVQKMGRWILQPSNKEQGERDFIWWRCSECGQVIYSETEQDRQEYNAYCGRCGAKMC